ncbi:MAG: PRC-barrel domain-containing protein [Anaerolineae bacterium]
MAVTYLSQDLTDKPVVSLTNGEIIGHVKDLFIDPVAYEIAALITSKGSLLKRRIQAIPREQVKVWGQDVILVSGPDVVVEEKELPDAKKWLTLSGEVKGQEVVDNNGVRIGELGDLVVDTSGKIVGYDLAHVHVEGPVADSKRIPVAATRSFGDDVLLVEAESLT